jgi:hypothetical protein
LPADDEAIRRQEIKVACSRLTQRSAAVSGGAMRRQMQIFW